jgi:cysteinyl-tRNA synthetase
MKTSEVKDTEQKWHTVELELNQYLIKQQHEVREALADNFDTPRAINDLFLLVK